MTANLDSLELCGLEVACIIGDLPEERVREQSLIIDLTLTLDLRPAARSDALCDTVDYAGLSAEIRAALQQANCRMIERAAECVAAVALRDSRVKKVRVRVEKRERVEGLRAAAVVIERQESCL
ncbi:MAG: dihydroneopterin aldolase [Kiritimatiellae bacterium]|nr:dihydroneopterin aldolase [Kiritimatiellia bacterium]